MGVSWFVSPQDLCLLDLWLDSYPSEVVSCEESCLSLPGQRPFRCSL